MDANAACVVVQSICRIVPYPLVGEGQGEGYDTHCVCSISALEHDTAAVLFESSKEKTSR